ncbi:MAG TPA: HAD family hydrolase [Candidatus Methylomirabilis sp.]|nr:HAD family hydrolase [Candidatus Methylomirabilis sp.]
MSYRAVLFDLFDTLVSFDRSRLPEISVNGKVIRSTAGKLYEAFCPFAPGIELPDFANALLWSWQEAERIRNESHREVGAPERLGFLLARLGLDPGALGAEALPALLATHQRELSRAIVLPPHHRPFLRALKGRYRLAVVSNFDYTPTALGVLEREGIAALFDTVLVSDEVGWRKPKPVIFETALDRLGVDAAEALFVGDRIDADVAGAQGVGMGSAWINPGSAPLPPDMRPPDFEIRDLVELGPVLGI